MAVSSTKGLSPVQLLAKRISVTDTPSPVQQNLTAKKEEAAKNVKYDEREDFFKLKAFELKKMLTFYNNMGMSQQAASVQAEAVDLIKKYQKLYGKIKVSDTPTTDTTA